MSDDIFGNRDEWTEEAMPLPEATSRQGTVSSEDEAGLANLLAAVREGNLPLLSQALLQVIKLVKKMVVQANTQGAEPVWLRKQVSVPDSEQAMVLDLADIEEGRWHWSWDRFAGSSGFFCFELGGRESSRIEFEINSRGKFCHTALHPGGGDSAVCYTILLEGQGNQSKLTVSDGTHKQSEIFDAGLREYSWSESPACDVPAWDLLEEKRDFSGWIHAGVAAIAKTIAEPALKKEKAPGISDQKIEMPAPERKYVCPKCKAAGESAEAKFCLRCGAALIEMQAARCRSCDQEISPQAKFCRHCGAAVAEVQPGRCAKCGQVISPQAKFCRHCGTPVSRTQQETLQQQFSLTYRAKTQRDMTTPKRFCPACGAPRNETALFCESCGVKFAAQGNAPAMPQAAAVPAVPPKPDSGWSVFVGEQLPPSNAAPVRTEPMTPAAAPPAMPAVQFSSSLRRPVFNLLLANALEIATAVATGTPAIDPMIVVRGAITVVTLLAGMVSGRKRGSASKMVLFGSLGLCAIQAFAFWNSVNSIMASPGTTERLLPHTVTQGLALLTGVRTAWRARK